MEKKKPVVLIIADGFGLRTAEFGNAVTQGKTPNYDYWTDNYERSVLVASGEAVGLVEGQMGNSEVGHLTLGGGRVIYQDILKINKAIENGAFENHEYLQAAITKAKKTGCQIHLFGLLGPAGVHSHTDHLMFLMKILSEHGVVPVVHIITDGRDTPTDSGLGFVKEVVAQAEKYPADIADVVGRYYAMDRDKRWDRNEKAYRAYTLREGKTAANAIKAVENSYAEGVTDEFVLPTILQPEKDLAVHNGDVLLFFNFRADRMRQIVSAFVRPEFNEFKTNLDVSTLDVISMTRYEKDLDTKVLFPKDNVHNPLAEILSKHGLKQFHTAETEKYAHVTYFFNGGREEPFEGEERAMIPSPKVATYDLQPEMSAAEVLDTVLNRLDEKDDDFILVNFANPDMVGHSGILEAGIKAVEVTDDYAGQIVKKVLEKGGVAMFTADHGNSEMMTNPLTKAPHTYHTVNPVAFFLIGEKPDSYGLFPYGSLKDVAPTILELLGIEKPAEMTGTSLIRYE